MNTPLRRIHFTGVLLCCLLATTGMAQTLTPVWLELAPAGAVLARAIVETGSACPVLKADGHVLPMQIRQPVPVGLKPLCEAIIPAGARSLRAGAKKLRLPKTPNRITVMGDTGCRVKGGQIQACDDPELWPFRLVAEQAARLQPDLIIHVGDYLYRESACPAMIPGCNGPHGDNWDAWNADFFTPARTALASAPWIFARGNHEDCDRSYRGWFYYLDPRPFHETCSDYTDPYVAQAGTLRLGVLDSGSTKDLPIAKPTQIPEYARELRELSGRADWLVDHHPFWGYTAKDGSVASTQMTLGPAWEDAKPEGIHLILSGHVHLFEFLALTDGRPNQLIAGDSGTELDAGITVDRSGNSVNGARVRAGEVGTSFGLTDLQRVKSGWTLTLRNSQGAGMIECDIPQSDTAACKSLHVER